MDKIIAKYDYINGTEKDESALQDDLGDADLGGFAEKLDLTGLKNIINLFIKKICNKDYARNNPRYSPGTWMASMTMRDLSTVIKECIENDRIPKSDCQDCLFDLYTALVRAGPGTSHFEVIEKVEGTADMNDYIQNLKGEKLQVVASALKEYTYIPEKNTSVEDYAGIVNSVMSNVVQAFVDKREDHKDLEIWTVFLDLYLFYLLLLKDIPEELHDCFHYCGNVFWYKYNRNPYKGFSDVKVLQQHLQKISELLVSPECMKGRIPETTKDYIEYLCDVKSDVMEVMFPEMMLLLKSLCLCKAANDMQKIIKSFKNLCDRLDEKSIDKNPTIFESWATNITEICEKVGDKKLVDSFVPRMYKDMINIYKPAKGHEKYWFPLVKAIWSVPTQEMQNIVKDIMNEKKLKRMWNWKENIHEAKEMVGAIEKLNLPTDEDDNEAWHSNSYCGDAVEKLIEMLKIQKLDDKIMAELGRMSLTHMERRTINSNCMVSRYFGDVNFQKVTEVVPELTKRFEALITDADYPWLDNWCRSNGNELFQAIIEAYKTSSDIPDEVNQALIRILDFCMEDDCEIINIENGDLTVWGLIIERGVLFVTKHCDGGTGNICKPVLVKILKFRHSEEESLRKTCTDYMQIAGRFCPEICSDFLEALLDWYIEEPSNDLMGIFYSVASVNPDVMFDRMDSFVDACTNDTETYSLQISLFYTLSTKHPKLFTQKPIDMLMGNHYNDEQIRPQVLLVMSNVSKEKAGLMDKHMEKILTDKTLTAMEQYSANVAVVNAAKNNEKFKVSVFDYLIKVLKKATDETRISVTIIGLKDMFVRYGGDMFKPHKDYFIKRRDEEHNTVIQDQFTSVIDLLEGRSLETVTKDVKDVQDDVVELDGRVTDNEAAVGTLTVRVDQHDEDISELGEGLDTVTQRVDFAEKDIDETKVKVEEIDNKTMTNAPKWSRDLTKLMNPPSEHDWRLLAQRLGYNNDDIRAWAAQHDPCMTVLSEWYATHKTREANYAVLTALQEMNRMDGAAIVENAMKAVEGVVEDEEVEYASPPPVFLSYQWGHQEEVKLIRNHLKMAGYECWMDIGQMGGGDKLFEKIDNGIRGAKVVICCVSEKYAKSPNCNREVNLSVNLGKPMIPLLMEKMAWPPKGSMGPIFSEYLFVRFFQRSGEETDDNRIWPVAKFQEMLMQLNCYGVKPEESDIDDMYKNWWIPVQEEIKIDKKKTEQTKIVEKKDTEEEKKSPDVFISYQWGKQKQILALYKRLTSLGLSCWMDIFQMGGGDSLYEKIDTGVRGCKVILTCITSKYSLSANCRREVSLADAIKKPMIPLLLEKMDWPPSGPMSMVFTQLLFINFYRDEEVQMRWTGPKFDELLEKISEHTPMILEKADDSNEKSEDHKENQKEVESPKTNDNAANGQKVENNNDESPGTNNDANKEPESHGNNNTVIQKNEPEPLPSSRVSVQRPVSQRGGRIGASGPQPTEKRQSPAKQVKPVTVQHDEAELTPSVASKPVSKQERPENTTKETKKSKSCTLL